MSDLIKPRTLKGFRDYPPAAMIPREWVIDTAKRVYRSYGFSPIDTPALEHLEILTGKGSEETDKQMYKFEDHGGRSVGMRFDLTVPLARFVSQNIQDLGTPFKRYQIANVWRGENTQRGRYREFMQCDFDTIGTTSLSADIEMVLVIHDLLTALDVGKFKISVNHRGILNGLLEQLNLTDKSAAVLRALDKLAKIGPEKVQAELEQYAGATPQQCEQLLAFVALEGTNQEKLEASKKIIYGTYANKPKETIGWESIKELSELLETISATITDSSHCCIVYEPSICRGLDYYTGIVVETLLDELPEIGSVCSGGRYDNLAQLYTKQELPGVGASLGLDRLLAALEHLDKLKQVQTPAEVFIPFFSEGHRPEYLSLAAKIRRAGFGVEFYPDAKKLGKQLQYADRRGFRVALVIGESEFSAGECQIKDLAKGTSESVALSESADEIITALQQILGAK